MYIVKDYDTYFNSVNYSHRKEKDVKVQRLRCDRRFKRHLIYLADSVGGYPSGAYYKEHWRDKTYKPRYVECHSGKRSGYIKTTCNRRLRNSNKLKLLKLNRGCYKKATEFWYEYC